MTWTVVKRFLRIVVFALLPWAQQYVTGHPLPEPYYAFVVAAMAAADKLIREIFRAET